MHQIENILVPTDFSSCADEALNFAIDLARRTDATITVYHAFHIPSNPLASVGMGRLSDQMKRDAEENMEMMIDRLPALGSVKHRTEIHPGHLVEHLDSTIKRYKADLIVMGTRGASGVEKVMGSHAASVIDEATCPVIALPNQTSIAGLRRILFASDLGELHDPGALDVLVMLARLFDAEVHILKVERNPDETTRPDTSALERVFQQVPHSYHMVAHHDIDQGISQYITKHKMDMLAIMPRKHDFFERLFKGSVTREMAYKTDIPLLAFHDA